MKRFFAALLLICCAGAFSGCLYDETVGSNIGPFVDPENNLTEDFLPTENATRSPSAAPSAGADAGAGEAEDTVLLDDGVTVRTTEPLIENEYYIGDGFKFYVPFVWREAMAVETGSAEEEGYTLLNHRFIYIASDGSEATLFVIRVLPFDYYQRGGTGDGTLLGEAVRDQNVYLLMPPDTVPAGFPDLSNYIAISEVVGDSTRFNFTRTDLEQPL